MPSKAKGEYLETDTGNKISRKAHIHGAHNIILSGKVVVQADAILRGDLTKTSSSTTSGEKRDPKAPILSITIGKYSFLSNGCVIHPPSRMSRGAPTWVTLKIGDNVFIGPDAVVQAAVIANGCYIGAKAVIGPLCVVKECVQILEGSVLPGGMVIPPGMVVGGSPARILGEIGIGENGWDGREAWRAVG